MPRTGPFDTFADEYDAWFETHEEMYAAELDALRRLMPAEEVDAIEVGVGSGKFAVPLGIRKGVEPSRKMADRARAQGIDVTPGAAERLVFADSSFDLVLMVTTICFVDDIAAAFSEARRVLRDDGCLILGFVDRNTDLGREYMAKKDESRFYGQATFFSTDEVIAHLNDAGFVVTNIRQTLIPGRPPGEIENGYGTGGFVALMAVTAH